MASRGFGGSTDRKLLVDLETVDEEKSGSHYDPTDQDPRRHRLRYQGLRSPHPAATRK